MSATLFALIGVAVVALTAFLVAWFAPVFAKLSAEHEAELKAAQAATTSTPERH